MPVGDSHLPGSDDWGKLEVDNSPARLLACSPALLTDCVEGEKQ